MNYTVIFKENMSSIMGFNFDPCGGSKTIGWETFRNLFAFKVLGMSGMSLN